MLQLAPVECRPRSALVHWESLRGLGMSLGDVVAVWAEETVATPLLLSVWVGRRRCRPSWPLRRSARGAGASIAHPAERRGGGGVG